MRFNKAKFQVLHFSYNKAVLQAWGRVSGKLLSRKGSGAAA